MLRTAGNRVDDYDANFRKDYLEPFFAGINKKNEVDFDKIKTTFFENFKIKDKG